MQSQYIRVVLIFTVLSLPKWAISSKNTVRNRIILIFRGSSTHLKCNIASFSAPSSPGSLAKSASVLLWSIPRSTVARLSGSSSPSTVLMRATILSLMKTPILSSNNAKTTKSSDKNQICPIIFFKVALEMLLWIELYCCSNSKSFLGAITAEWAVARAWMQMQSSRNPRCSLVVSLNCDRNNHTLKVHITFDNPAHLVHGPRSWKADSSWRNTTKKDDSELHQLCSHLWSGWLSRRTMTSSPYRIWCQQRYLKYTRQSRNLQKTCIVDPFPPGFEALELQNKLRLQPSVWPRRCFRMMQAPLWRPVFELVVSKHIPWTLSSAPHSFSTSNTAYAWASPVSDGSFGTASSCDSPLLVTSTGRPSTFLVPVRSGKSLPFQWTIRGNFGWNWSLISFDVAFRWSCLLHTGLC